MRKATSQSYHLRLAVAPGVSSSQLSELLTRQRAEEPDVILTFFEVTGDVLLEGLLEDRYDIGISLQGHSAPALKSRPLWMEPMAVAMPPSFRLLDQAKLTIAVLQDYPVYRWQAEACPLLDERLNSLMQVGHGNIQLVTSFEMMALWVAAGYGVGVSAHSRIERARGWDITARPLADGPYEIVTYLQRLHTKRDSVSEQFERRAFQITGADSM